MTEPEIYDAILILQAIAREAAVIEAQLRDNEIARLEWQLFLEEGAAGTD
jgi:hypothetical protein